MNAGTHPYDNYTSTSEPWCEEHPSHWQLATVRWIARVFAGATPDRENIDFWEGGSIPWLSSGDVNQGRITSASQFITQGGFAASSTKWIRPGSVVVALAGQGKTKGMAATVEFATTCNQSLGVLEPYEQVCDYRYLFYYLGSRYRHLRGLVGDGLRDGLNLEHLKSIALPLPPLAEQELIVQFLERQVSQIDTLIQNKRRLIDLLTEYHAAIINRAVTKGLDPNVPMKDSGIEWLGEVPAHWEVLNWGRITAILTDFTANGSFASLAENVEYLDEPSFARLIRLTDLRRDVAEESGIYVSEKAYTFLSKSALFGGEFLIANVGAYAGLVAQMPHIGVPATLGPNMMLARFRQSRADNDFMVLAATATYIQSQLRSSALASAAQPKLNKSDFRRTLCVLPPMTEQKRIVEWLRHRLRRGDEVIAGMNREVELLREYRASLVSEVVTGKIDVRDVVRAEEDSVA
jgi:type I restriction enzyme, S subunit